MKYRLFEVSGVEIEYAVVNKDTLEVMPAVDRVLSVLGGSPDAHPSHGNAAADNELAAHVVELKCVHPCTSLALQLSDFEGLVRRINYALAGMGGRLMPTGSHPFMDPARESNLWAHEDKEIYESYNRVFGCRGHGWFNLQSVHLNLPFDSDRGFSQLHNAISLMIPLLPALAASSPFNEGRIHEWRDSRLFHYVANQRKLPSIIGDIVPEPVNGEEEYREKILAPMYREIAPFDPEGILQDEWLNSRSAIARFDRGAIEIRCLDTQEAPLADLALCRFASVTAMHLMKRNQDLYGVHSRMAPGLLKSLFLATAKEGMSAVLPTDFPAEAFGLGGDYGTVGDFLRHLVPMVMDPDASTEDALFLPAILNILDEGSLSERILAALRPGFGLAQVYAALCDCLESDTLFFSEVAKVRSEPI